MYALFTRAPKPYLSHTNYKKSRAGGAVGGKIGGEKGKSSKRGSAGAFSIITTSI